MPIPMSTNIASVLELIPHRPPMVFIDEIITISAEHIHARTQISPGRFFVQADGSLPAWAGIELMAQTIAAYGGALAKAAGRPVEVGFLLGTRRYETDCAAFPAGCTLDIHAHCLLLDEQGLGAFECRIESAVGTATATLSIFQPTDPAAFLSANTGPA